jgi:hypothetical protein
MKILKITTGIVIVLVFIGIMNTYYRSNKDTSTHEDPSLEKVETVVVKKEIKNQEGSSKVADDCREGISAPVQKLLNTNNIDISRLNSISSEGNLLGYATRSTGYTYRVYNHRTEPVFDGRLDNVVLDVCYNNRRVLTRNIRMRFINGIFESASAFDFSSITVNPIPSVSLMDAKKTAYKEQSLLIGVEPKLGYYDVNTGDGQVTPGYILVWEFNKGANVLIDAHSGGVIRSFDGRTY